MTDSKTLQALRSFSVDALQVAIYADRKDLGKAAALHVIERISRLQKNQDQVRMVVGSAPSQDDFFHFLGSEEISGSIEWQRVEVFHMDEYIGLAADHPQNFRAYQRKHFLSRVHVGTFHEIHGERSNIEAECRRLSDLLKRKPVDLVCLGIGENGHLAFNDPPVDFLEEEFVKVVELDSVCRQQQVNDGCFRSLDDVPKQAITLSMRVFREAKSLSGVVPAASKADAIAATLNGPVSGACPATLMRQHPDARLFLEPASAALLR